MSQTVPSAPADRFALIIEGLRQAVARRCGLNGLAGSLIILICSRLRRITARFTRYALVPSPIPSSPEPVIATPGEARRTQSRRRPQPASPYPLPRNRAWLLRLVPETAAVASQLRHFLADPEVAALLAAAPKLQSILRPLCHMLGIRPAQALCLFLQSPDAPSLIPHDAPPPAAPIAVPPIGFSLDGAAQGSSQACLAGNAPEGLPPPQNAPPSLAPRISA